MYFSSQRAYADGADGEVWHTFVVHVLMDCPPAEFVVRTGS